MPDKPISLTCSDEEIAQLKALAGSTTAGLWRIKRAKVLLGTLEGTGVVRLMHQVRVPAKSIEKCIEEFTRRRMSYFDQPSRSPTEREASVERMLAFLEQPPPLSSELWDTLTVHYIGTHFTARDIRAIRDMVAMEGNTCVARIVRQVCSRFQLLGADGKPRLAVVTDILRRMSMDNLIFLSVKSPARRNGSRPPPKIITPQKELRTLGPHELSSVALVLVRKGEDFMLWNAMIHHYHYIPGHRLFGPQLRYLVYCGNGCGGASGSLDGMPVAALSFSSSSWRVSSRDAYIGWNDAQRRTNLPLVLNNSRFLILPWIRVPNLASRILGMAARRVPGDWEARYGRRPLLLETFVERERFVGTCYKAANWVEVGMTAGYSLLGNDKRRAQPARSVFLLPLHKHFREILCTLKSQEHPGPNG